eukprot:SAG11_NODE_28021_length_326_cov_0.823789_1_plen_36_part_10
MAGSGSKRVASERLLHEFIIPLKTLYLFGATLTTNY